MVSLWLFINSVGRDILLEKQTEGFRIIVAQTCTLAKTKSSSFFLNSSSLRTVEAVMGYCAVCCYGGDVDC